MKTASLIQFSTMIFQLAFTLARAARPLVPTMSPTTPYLASLGGVSYGLARSHWCKGEGDKSRGDGLTHC